MSRLKSLLVPLALVLLAIAVFEAGTRYGATNMRAYAIASELQFPLRIYVESRSTMDSQTLERIEQLIDLRIGTGALQRDIWYLNNRSRSALEQTLAYALSVRGDAPAARFEALRADDNAGEMTELDLREIEEAIKAAKKELVDDAPAPNGPAQAGDGATIL